MLVTGAAGLIGSELCGRLAENGHGVIALVHRTRDLRRNDGSVVSPLLWSGNPPSPRTIVAIVGDVSVRDLGLSRDEVNEIMACVDVVIHAAAETGFQPTSSLHRRVNVDGTREVLALLHKIDGDAPGLVHVSTAYVSGERSGTIDEDECLPHANYANGYEATKAEAEALVRASNLEYAIARPSIVVGRADTGAIGRFENIYGFLKLIGSGRVAVLPSHPGATLDLVPIDHVIEGLVDIVERFPASVGQTYHLVSGDPVLVAELVQLNYPGFHVPRLVSPDRFDPTKLDPLAAMIYEQVTTLYETYLRRDARFVNVNLFKLSGRICPPTGPHFLRRIVDYATEAGFVVPDFT